MELNLKKITEKLLENYLETKARIEFRNSQIDILKSEIKILPLQNFTQKLSDMPKGKNNKPSSKQESYAIRKEGINEKIYLLEYNNCIDNMVIKYIDSKYECLNNDIQLLIKLRYFEKERNDKEIIKEYHKRYEYISEKSFYRKLNKAKQEMSFTEEEYFEFMKYTEMM